MIELALFPEHYRLMSRQHQDIQDVLIRPGFSQFFPCEINSCTWVDERFIILTSHVQEHITRAFKFWQWYRFIITKIYLHAFTSFYRHYSIGGEV